MENETANSNILETMPIGALFIKMAIPAVLSQLINILYNLMDKMFIGHMKDGGAEAMNRPPQVKGETSFHSLWQLI